MVKRKQYTKEEALNKYRLYCHKIGINPNPHLIMKYNKETNIVKLLNTENQLVYGFHPEIELKNDLVTVGNISTIPRSK